MAKQKRFLCQDQQTKEKFGTTGYVIEAFNHLLQKRQFAFEGRYWYYMPDTRSPFIQVNSMDLPENAIQAMMDYTGLSREILLWDRV